MEIDILAFRSIAYNCIDTHDPSYHILLSMCSLVKLILLKVCCYKINSIKVQKSFFFNYEELFMFVQVIKSKALSKIPCRNSRHVRLLTCHSASPSPPPPRHPPPSP